MRSHPCVSIQNNTLCSLGFLRSGNGFSSLYFPVSRVSFDSRTCGLHSYVYIKVIARSGAMQRGFCLRRKTFLVDAMDEGSVGISSFHDLGDTDGSVEDAFSSSEGEDSDGEIVLQPITDIDLPTTKEHFRPADDSITMAAHRFATLGRVQKRRKLINLFNLQLRLLLYNVFALTISGTLCTNESYLTFDRQVKTSNNLSTPLASLWSIYYVVFLLKFILVYNAYKRINTQILYSLTGHYFRSILLILITHISLSIASKVIGSGTANSVITSSTEKIPPVG